MEKANLGISVGLLGMIMYFTCLFSGYVGALLLAGYILLHERNDWLKKIAVKAVVLMFCISLLEAGINLIPNVISAIDDVSRIFAETFTIAPLTRLVSAIISIINIIEKVLFIALGVSALKQGDIAIPVVDKLVSAAN